jgi:DNA-binding NtrC family response regulator
VRDLGNAIENAIVHSESELLQEEDFGRLIADVGMPGNYEEAKNRLITKFQRDFISASLRRNDGNMTQTAEEMGVTRQGLFKMMKNCGLTPQNIDSE